MKDYHYILGVSKTADKSEIKKAYRKLSKKFHPDVNDGDAFFTDRFKEIQEAYEFLMGSTDEPRQQPPPTERSQATPPEIVLFEVSKTDLELGDEILVRWRVNDAQTVRINLIGLVEASGEKRLRPASAIEKGQLTITAINPTGEATRNLSIKVRAAKAKKSKGLLWLAAVVIICLGGVAWAVAETNAANQRAEEVREAKDREWQATVDRVNREARERMNSVSEPPATVTSSYSGNNREYDLKTFTIGSTRSEVISAQGTPSGVQRYGNNETLRYGLSSVDLDNGRVTSYANLYDNLKVIEKNVRASSVSSTFSIGSARSEVISAQGTPSGVQRYGNNETLRYGLSSVDLDNGQVTSYANLSDNLKVVEKNVRTSSGPSTFTIGSTRSEVISAQGTPSGVQRYGNNETLRYGLSSVDLDNGRVTSYANLSDNLKIR